MTDLRASALLRWLPPPSLPGLRQRGLIVCGVALVIALVQWLTASRAHPLLASLVYSYAISLCIWFFTDPLRIALHRWLRTEPPHYWALNTRSLAWLVVGIVLGYVLGITAGDLYVGQSTWALLVQAPQRFWGVWLGALGISLGFLFYFYQREKALALQHEATEAQLRLLESQLEPHMLFNTLANLRALIATDPPRALTMLDRLNDYLRATLRDPAKGDALRGEVHAASQHRGQSKAADAPDQSETGKRGAFGRRLGHHGILNWPGIMVRRAAPSSVIVRADRSARIVLAETVPAGTSPETPASPCMVRAFRSTETPRATIA